VRGAKALEKDIRGSALHSFSDLLTKGNLRNLGKAGAGLVPFVFDKVFGSKPFGLRFISRSILATSLFWLILMAVKRPNWGRVAVDMFGEYWFSYVTLVPVWYILDWLSLVKSKWLLRLISQKYSVFFSFAFLCGDVILSYLLTFLFKSLNAVVYAIYLYSLRPTSAGIGIFVWTFSQFIDVEMRLTLIEYSTFSPIYDYINSENVNLYQVIVPSTLFTSAWSLLLFVSCLLAQLFVPLDYVRRLTNFLFDVEHHPLTAIAWVAGTLIMLGALAIKAVRWIY
jgi:hypothetical protein